MHESRPQATEEALSRDVADHAQAQGGAQQRDAKRVNGRRAGFIQGQADAAPDKTLDRGEVTERLVRVRPFPVCPGVVGAQIHVDSEQRGPRPARALAQLAGKRDGVQESIGVLHPVEIGARVVGGGEDGTVARGPAAPQLPEDESLDLVGGSDFAIGAEGFQAVREGDGAAGEEAIAVLKRGQERGEVSHCRYAGRGRW